MLSFLRILSNFERTVPMLTPVLHNPDINLSYDVSFMSEYCEKVLQAF